MKGLNRGAAAGEKCIKYHHRRFPKESLQPPPCPLLIYFFWGGQITERAMMDMTSEVLNIINEDNYEDASCD